MRGYNSTDAEANKIATYYSFAQAFNYTPKQVEELDVTIMQGLMILHAEKNKIEKEMIDKTSRR